MLRRDPSDNNRLPYIGAEWKEEILDKKIIDISYDRFWEIWNRTVLVAGAQDGLRPYSLRVGSSGRLNGKDQYLSFRDQTDTFE